MQGQSVYQYDCRRCGRTWYEKQERKAGQLVLKMELSTGEELNGDLPVLCDTCETIVANYVRSVLKNMKKVSSSSPRQSKGKSKAKEGETSSPPLSQLGPTVPRANAVSTPATVTPPPRSSPSRQP